MKKLGPAGFPYDSVYFKASSDNNLHRKPRRFPYDSVYFKATYGSTLKKESRNNFHTIPSILKLYYIYFSV